MSAITTSDGTRIFYKDWGQGQPIVFSHGWPLNADAWDEHLYFFASHGYRAIAHDRRGHGRSGQPWNGNDMDTYADDLAALMDGLDLSRAILVGHSMGGGEVVRYVGRHGTRRVAKVGLVSAVPPIMLKTEANPGGLSRAVFDDLRSSLKRDRAQFYRDLSGPFFGANRRGAEVSHGLSEQFWLQCMQVGFRAAYDGIKQFSETDFTDDLKKIDVSTLIVHGDDDQLVPVETGGRASSKIVKDSTLKVYVDAPHGLPATHKDRLNADLLAFAGAAR
jgi:non-heme chloroperoxidase